MAGRPRIFTDEQRKEKYKAYQKLYARHNREKLNAIALKYCENNRQNIRDRQNARNRVRALETKEIKSDPFYLPELEGPDEKEKNQIRRMAELIKIGCIEKKTKGSNYMYLTSKPSHKRIMETIGFDDYNTWISRNWVSMAIKIVGWNDITKRCYYKKMILYGYLKWMLGLNTDIIKLILEYLPNKKYDINKLENII